MRPGMLFFFTVQFATLIPFSSVQGRQFPAYRPASRSDLPAVMALAADVAPYHTFVPE